MRNKTLYLLFAISIVLIICIFGIVLYINFGPRPTITTAQPENNYPVTKEQQTQQDKGVSAGNLLNKLPYHGKYFSFYYDYANDQYTLYIDPSNKDAGNKEFTQFLLSNGGLTKDWYSNLTTIYGNPPPVGVQ